MSQKDSILLSINCYFVQKVGYDASEGSSLTVVFLNFKMVINYDLEVVEGRTKVRWKAETLCFFIIEISKFLGTMR